MKMKYAVVLSILLLTGCKTIVYVPTPVFVEPPEVLIRECDILAPPSKSLYMKSTYAGKEALLTDYAVDQTLNLTNCNEDKKALQKWVKRQKTIFEVKK